MNDIIKLLDLEDEDIKFLDIAVESIAVEGSSKIVTLEKKLEEQFCPLCGFKMHSKGISIRTVKHQVIQDGYKLILKLRQRRWLCTNPDCRYAKNDEYSFVDKAMARNYFAEIMPFPVARLTQALVQREVNREAARLNTKTLKNMMGLISPAVQAVIPDKKFQIKYPMHRL